MMAPDNTTFRHLPTIVPPEQVGHVHVAQRQLLHSGVHGVHQRHGGGLAEGDVVQVQPLAPHLSQHQARVPRHAGQLHLARHTSDKSAELAGFHQVQIELLIRCNQSLDTEGR